jgi:AbrB family looped-hinge helix DNA binding protein
VVTHVEPQSQPVFSVKPKACIEARSTLGDKGRFVIPAALREAMGASQGDQLMLHMEGQELRVITREAAMRRAQERARKFAIPGRLMSDELIAERRAEVLKEELEEAERHLAHTR